MILGASARAAARSAIRAGFAPAAADMFADSDLVAACPTVRVVDYPRGLARAARELPHSAWIYTGGLENHPALVEKIARERPLLGNGGDVLRRVRDPGLVQEALQRWDLPSAKVVLDGHGPASGQWLIKPLRSSGGKGIREWTSGGAIPRERYLQQRVLGESHSGLFVAAQGRAKLLGVTQQLIGQQWLGASSFSYCGSIGPVALSPPVDNAWRRIGDCLAAEFSLKGIFGVDAIVSAKGVIPIEVNPRYTASVEVLERATGFAVLEAHCRACRDEFFDERWSNSAFCGKAVVFARQTAFATEELHQLETAIADVPTVGATIHPGEPIVSIFAEARSPAGVDAELRGLAARVYETVGG